MPSISHWTIRKSPFLLFLSPLPFHSFPLCFLLYLEKEMATHSSILTWRIPWTEEPGGLLSMGSQRVGHDWRLTLFSVSSTTDWCTLTMYKEHYCAWNQSPSLNSLLWKRNILPSLSYSSFFTILPSFFFLLWSSSYHHFLGFPSLLLWSEGRHSALGLWTSWTCLWLCLWSPRAHKCSWWKLQGLFSVVVKGIMCFDTAFLANCIRETLK